jgi:hypothetical protein
MLVVKRPGKWGFLPDSNFELAAAVVSSIEIDSGFATGYLPD